MRLTHQVARPLYAIAGQYRAAEKGSWRKGLWGGAFLVAIGAMMLGVMLVTAAIAFPVAIALRVDFDYVTRAFFSLLWLCCGLLALSFASGCFFCVLARIIGRLV